MIRRRGLMSATGTPSNALYWLGDECTAKTGGWVTIQPCWTSTYWAASNRQGRVTKNNDSVLLRGSASSNISTAPICTADKIFVQGKTKLIAELSECYEPITKYTYVILGITDTQVATGPGSYYKRKRVQPTPDSKIEVDVSGVDGEYYVIVLFEEQGSRETYVTLTKVWLE